MANETTKLINTPRQAFEGADVEASRIAHDNRKTEATEEGHQKEGGLLKPVIFGGLDGILTSFAIVAGSAGGNLSPEVVLILGFSNIMADALSMVRNLVEGQTFFLAVSLTAFTCIFLLRL